LVFLLTPVFHLIYDRIFWSNLLYIANFTERAAFRGGANPTEFFFPAFHGMIPTVQLGTFWSLCVEEQFYLVWPFVVWLLPSRKAMMTFCAVGVCAVVSLRTFLYFDDTAAVVTSHYLYYSTYTRCDTLFVGSWIALWLRGVELTSIQVRKIAYALIFIPGSILIAGSAKQAVGFPMR